jgi:Flp pilus assembly protein TadG
MLFSRYRLSACYQDRQQGAAALELALVLPVLVALICGIMDFGDAWYMKQVLNNASREGARYGSRYQTDGGGAHKLPNALSPSIASWVVTNYASLLPADANLNVNPAGTGYASGNQGDDLTVTVTARKTWFIIGQLVPGLGDHIDLSATTVMKCE